MAFGKTFWRLVAGVSLLTALYAFQRPFRVYPSMEPYDDIPLPPDYTDHNEWTFARLMYPPHPEARFTRAGACDRPIGAKAAPAGARIIRAPTVISPWP